MGTIFRGNPIALIMSVPLFAVMVELGKMFIESRLKKKGFSTDTAEYYRGEATEDEIDFAVHYQNKKLAFFYEHSKIKKWVDQNREKKQLRKLQKKAQAEAAQSQNSDVTDQPRSTQADTQEDNASTQE
ncbi:MAG: hypothetical protein J6V39_05045, partial [Clostridia bacterium]|nr:hypothetical protein [Clostridia bacterium]